MEKTEIKAVEMVRRIRDEQYEQLMDKSPEELLRFYRQEAEAANREAEGFLAIIERAREEFREGKTISLEEMKQAFSG